MSICINATCKNEAVGGNSYKKALCFKCKKEIGQGKPLYVICAVCKKIIFIQNFSGGIRIVCSKSCNMKRVAERNKKIYNEKKPKYILCIRCDKPIRRQGKKVNKARKKFCSKVCYNRNEYYRNLFKRHFDKALRLQHIIIKGLTIKK